MLLVFFPEDRTYMKVLSAADLPEGKPFKILKKLPDHPPNFVQYEQEKVPEDTVWALHKSNVNDPQLRTCSYWWSFENYEELLKFFKAKCWKETDFEIQYGDEFNPEWEKLPSSEPSF